MKTMQKHSLGVVAVAVFALLLVSLFVSVPVHAQAIKVGVLYSATGPFAGFGKPAQRGAMLALDQANAAGGIKGRRIETIVYDAESNAEQASRQMKKLVQRDKVTTLIGPEVWRVATLMYALAIEYKIPIFTDISAPDAYPAEQLAWTFNNAGGSDTNLLSSMHYFKSLGVKKVAFFGTADPLGEKIVKDIKEIGSRLGITLVGVQMAPVTSTDVTPQMAVLKNSSPEALVVLGSGPFGNMAMNNASQVGMNIPTDFIGANIIPAYMEGLGAAAAKNMRAAVHKAVVYKDLDDKDPAKPSITAFANAFKAKYGEEIDWASACGYDGGAMIVDALKNAGTDPQAIKKYMEGFKNWYAPGSGRHMTMLLPQYHYLQHDFKDMVMVTWDFGEKRFKKVAYVRDFAK